MKKQPKQERSRQIVESILTAATRILSRMRLGDATTNQIAEEAGVGVGSLYDYFPNKKSIVTSLIDRRMATVVGRFREQLYRENRTLEQTIDEMVAFVRADYLERKDFLREIFQLAPETGRMEALFRARIEATELMSTFLHERGFVSDRNEAERRAFVVVHGALGLIEGYVMVGPRFLSVEEVSGHLRSFLRGVLLPKA